MLIGLVVSQYLSEKSVENRMKKFLSLLLLSGILLSGLTACGESRQVSKIELLTAPHFWQRSATTDAIYQRGPKAQQMLNRDISRCVTELRELKRLGAIRHVTPAEIDEQGLVPDPDTPQGTMDSWDTPYRDGYLRAEHLEYHDFETCMMAKGWERIEHVPYDVAEEGREAYIDAVIGEQYQSQYPDLNP